MIRLESLTKRWDGGQVAVDALDLEVGEGEICMLVGPSGCGKTTTLKMINRLIEPTSGRIVLGGEDVTGADPVELRRRIGYVIQNVGLFPHLTVAGNVATDPRLLQWDKDRIRRRVDELLELVGLDPARYRKRYPHQLSGGQRQRVGVARALGVDPPVLLMDEPFGAIDPITRDRLQAEFLRLQSEVGKTVVFVTHDIDEAVRLGDRIAVLREGGVLEQYAPPTEVLGRPASPFVADFVGADRGLKRLGVMTVDAAQLEQPVTVTPDLPLTKAVLVMDEPLEPADWAAVVDGDGRLVGELRRADARGGGVVAHRCRPVTAPTVGTGATLKDVSSALLLSDVGWVAVVDGGRLLGVLTPGSLHAAARRAGAD
ncbi:MAG TPA: betaine/proline/choline family ABC transporter ATP-binding protein [Acidimicrobiales bacterium]|nr:betaine/proline/choline family ABC transporter ATP-binding protein [Acidimicrobiales bacterium]